jgi:hypothetical protein
MSQNIMNQMKDYIVKYMVEKYPAEMSVFINSENEEDEYDEFVEEIFNSENHSFYEFVFVEEDHTLCTCETLLLLNWVNKYIRDELGNPEGLSGKITEQKIIDNFGLLYVWQNKDTLLELLKDGVENYSDREDTDSETA